ncbi:MAG: DNA-binding protein [Clostridia bacterium]|nr:DNA-binding protein [Clostridia bacterium]
MKDLNLCLLLDFYSFLLSEKQAGMMQMYYNDDLSLSEIAQEMDITRQGVYDAIKKSEGILKSAEEQMGFAGRFIDMAKKLSAFKAQIEKLIDNKENIEGKLQDLLDKIEELRASSGVADYGI